MVIHDEFCDFPLSAPSSATMPQKAIHRSSVISLDATL
jgi:hypothetical protein